MQTQQVHQNRDHLNGGLSGQNLSTAVGGELMDAFFGAAIGGALGIPTSFGALDMGTAADMIDEYHKDKAREFELGQKSTITRDFNFGGMHYSEIRPDDENDDNPPGWRPRNGRDFEAPMQTAPVLHNPEVAQKAFSIPAL